MFNSSTSGGKPEYSLNASEAYETSETSGSNPKYSHNTSKTSGSGYILNVESDNRSLSATGLYHVMIRGVNQQDIFTNDDERFKYLHLLIKASTLYSTKILAWCLMTNHVHLLIYQPDILPSEFMQYTSGAYAGYFNEKHERTGHLFQGRYLSENIENERYLFNVFRYIHMNPEKAGISQTSAYPWSSYHEYAAHEPENLKNAFAAMYSKDMLLLPKICDIEYLKDYFHSDPAGFTDILKSAPDKDFISTLDKPKTFSDDEAFKLADSLINGGIYSLAESDKAKRNEAIITLHKSGLKASQIIRITGFTKSEVYHLLEKS